VIPRVKFLGDSVDPLKNDFDPIRTSQLSESSNENGTKSYVFSPSKFFDNNEESPIKTQFTPNLPQQSSQKSLSQGFILFPHILRKFSA
jgi:hypothetical protein